MAGTTAKETEPLPVRRVRFSYPDDLPVVWNPRFPEFACAANGVSLIMPFAEPYFVQSVRAVRDRLDGDLAARADEFVRQESGHHAQHRRFNDLVVVASPRAATVERWMRRTYGWLGRTRSARFSLAFAAGSETIAFAMARWIERHLGDLFPGADPVVTTLFLWHLAEEVEHKSVAYDVFEAVDGSRWRYAQASASSLVLLLVLVWAATLAMLRDAGRLWSPAAHWRLARWSLSLAFEVLPTLAASAMPGHHPSDLVDPPFLTRWLRGYDPATRTLTAWDFGS